MRHCFRCLLLIILLAATRSEAQLTPIAVTGFNNDAVAEGPPSSLATTTLQVDGGSSNRVMYTNAFRTFAGIAGGGLPDNGTIVHGGDTYQLANYTGNNALYIYRNETHALTLVTPASYSRVRLLGFTTEGASSLNIRFNFTDGSFTDYFTNYSLPDWFNGAANVVLQGFGRCSRVAAAPWGDDAYPSNPRMYYIEVSLNCPDKNKNLQSVLVSNFSTFPNNAPFPNTVIMALSGITDPPPVINSVIIPCDCNGPNGSASLTVTGATGPYTYSWNTSPAQSGPVATGLAPGNYTCNITDGAGCIIPHSITVPLNNNGTIAATATPLTICAGDPVTLSVNVVNGIYTIFGWRPVTTPASPYTIGQTQVVNPLVTTTYQASAQRTAGGGWWTPCDVTAFVTVTVNQLPNTPTVMTTPVCPGGTTTLTVTSALPGEVYNWYDVATGGIPLATGTSYTLTNVTAPATYYVEAVNSASGCIAVARTAVTITLLAVPSAPAVNNVTVCAGTSATLQIQSPQAGFTYQWYNVATGGTPLATGVSFTVPGVTAPVTYYAEAVSAGSCISTTRTPVTVSILTQLAQPVVTMTNASFTSLTFSWNAVPNALSYEVSTNGGGSWAVPSSGPGGTSHTINGLTGNTTVTLWVRALRNQPCETSNPGVASGTTLSSKEIFVPNVFTPNGDGKNDILKVYGNYVAAIQFRIFNQWGQVVFVSENINNGWNGAVNGQPQPVGVYAYTLKVTLQDGTIINKKGSVNLIR